MSYRTEIYTAGYWMDPGMRYATQAEALEYGRDTTRTTQAAYRAVDSQEPVNYQYHGTRLAQVVALSFADNIRKIIWQRILPNGRP